MKNEIETLKKHFGNYSEVARQLGITGRHFRRIRNDRVQPGESLSRLIRFLASEYQGCKHIADPGAGRSKPTGV